MLAHIGKFKDPWKKKMRQVRVLYLNHEKIPDISFYWFERKKRKWKSEILFFFFLEFSSFFPSSICLMLYIQQRFTNICECISLVWNDGVFSSEKLVHYSLRVSNAQVYTHAHKHAKKKNSRSSFDLQWYCCIKSVLMGALYYLFFSSLE